MYVLREGRWKIYRIWGFPFFIPSMCTMRSDIRIHLTILFFFLKKKKERRRNKTFTDTPPYYRSGGTAILDWKRSREGKHSLQGKGLLLSLFVHTSPFKGNIKFTVPTLPLSPAPQRLQILAHWSAKTSFLHVLPVVIQPLPTRQSFYAQERRKLLVDVTASTSKKCQLKFCFEP